MQHNKTNLTICIPKVDSTIAKQEIFEKIRDLRIGFIEKIIEIPNKKTGLLSSFNFYSFYHPQDLISYYLIRNKQEGCLLLAEKPSIDYFLIMQDNYVINEIEMIENLRKMDCIIAVFNFSSKEFQMSEYLIFEK